MNTTDNKEIFSSHTEEQVSTTRFPQLAYDLIHNLNTIFNISFSP